MSGFGKQKKVETTDYGNQTETDQEKLEESKTPNIQSGESKLSEKEELLVEKKTSLKKKFSKMNMSNNSSKLKTSKVNTKGEIEDDKVRGKMRIKKKPSPLNTDVT